MTYAIVDSFILDKHREQAMPRCVHKAGPWLFWLQVEGYKISNCKNSDMCQANQIRYMHGKCRHYSEHCSSRALPSYHSDSTSGHRFWSSCEAFPIYFPKYLNRSLSIRNLFTCSGQMRIGGNSEPAKKRQTRIRAICAKRQTH